jgi:hypothetical protein
MKPLHVYRLIVGNHECVVAVPSKAAAAKAWGVPATVFKNGHAREVSTLELNPRWLLRAKQKPGQVLRRLRGTGDKFRVVSVAGH